MTLAPFANSADIATRLGRTFSTAEAAQADAFCVDASAVIRDFLRQDITQTERVITVLSPDGPWLELPQVPVISINTVWVNNQQVGDWSLIGERLYRVYGWRWPSVDTIPPLAIYGLQSSVKVDYVSGFATDPDVIVTVCRNMALRAMDNPTGATGGEAIDDYKSANYAQASTGAWLTDADKRALRRYRRAAFSIDMGTGTIG